MPALAFTLFGLRDACVAPKGKRRRLGRIKKKGQMCKFLFSLRPKCIVFPKTVGKQRDTLCGGCVQNSTLNGYAMRGEAVFFLILPHWDYSPQRSAGYFVRKCVEIEYRHI